MILAVIRPMKFNRLLNTGLQTSTAIFGVMNGLILIIDTLMTSTVLHGKKSGIYCLIIGINFLCGHLLTCLMKRPLKMTLDKAIKKAINQYYQNIQILRSNDNV